MQTWKSNEWFASQVSYAHNIIFRSVFVAVLQDNEQSAILTKMKISLSWINKELIKANLIDRKATKSAQKAPHDAELQIQRMHFRLSNYVAMYHIAQDMIINLDQLGLFCCRISEISQVYRFWVLVKEHV